MINIHTHSNSNLTVCVFIIVTLDTWNQTVCIYRNHYLNKNVTCFCRQLNWLIISDIYSQHEMGPKPTSTPSIFTNTNTLPRSCTFTYSALNIKMIESGLIIAIQEATFYSQTINTWYTMYFQ